MTRGIGAGIIGLAFLVTTGAGAWTRVGAHSEQWPVWESRITGGVQLDIDPRKAEVYVDGAYVGLVSDFSGYYKHLDVAAGPHLLMILAPDYDPWIIPVMVAAGRTLPIRGTLAREYGR